MSRLAPWEEDPSGYRWNLSRCLSDVTGIFQIAFYRASVRSIFIVGAY